MDFLQGFHTLVSTPCWFPSRLYINESKLPKEVSEHLAAAGVEVTT
jgi:hypothetical protein